jgi:hypothetical protein
MKEGLFILLVILVLLGLTAIRYRKQITGMIGLARALKDAKDVVSRGTSARESSSVQLVHCTKCGIWVPENKAARRGRDLVCEACR